MQRIVIATSLWLAACSANTARAPKAPSRLASSAPVATAPADAAVRRNLDLDDDVTCKIEIGTGTGMSRPVCRSQLEIFENKRQADELLLHPAELESHF